jgi:hypothetical protein
MVIQFQSIFHISMVAGEDIFNGISSFQMFLKFEGFLPQCRLCPLSLTLSDCRLVRVTLTTAMIVNSEFTIEAVP